MNIGLIDVDGHNYPNIPLMKLAAWHTDQGDTVSWYDHKTVDKILPYDRVYVSKIFSFTPDYPHEIKAKEIRRGG